MTSDEYFKKFKDKFDLIFIDGLHHYNQVEKDIYNSLEILNDKRIIKKVEYIFFISKFFPLESILTTFFLVHKIFFFQD